MFRERWQSVFLMSTSAFSHLCRSVSKRHWICWQMGFSKRPMANLWNLNLLPLFPQDMLAFMSCCCWPTSPQLSISCISKNVTLSLRRYHISLKSKTVPLSRSWKVQPTLQILVWSTTIPKAEGFSYLLPDTQCRMCWQRTTWEGSLLPLISGGCILPHVEPLPFFKLMYRQ